jgi:hypothetical protein
MKQRRVLALVVIAMAAIILTGGLMASNMGFKLNYTLTAQQSGVSAAGFQLIGLPYNQQVGINTAKDLLDDIDLGGVDAVSLQKYNILSGGYDPYPGPGGDFTLSSAEGYFLGVNTSGPYIIVGSHNPGLTVQLKGQASGVSAAGFQLYSHPYHGVAASAKQFLDEIAPEGASIQKYNIQSGGYDPYPGPGGDFALVPGEAYFVGVSGDKNFIPAHY